MQVSTFKKNRKTVEYIVVDAGLGIPTTLRATHSELTSDADALDHAIREGVTRDKNVGQGNGLYGSFQICCHSKGVFQVESGNAKLWFTEERGLHVRSERIAFQGTLVAAQIDFSVPHLLEGALKFGGKAHQLVDFVELHYETDGPDALFVLKQEAKSFGSRMAGAPVRNSLSNLARMCPDQRIIVDLSDIALVSSSFADEVFGKLFNQMGPMEFMRRFELRNVDATVKKTDRQSNQPANVCDIALTFSARHLKPHRHPASLMQVRPR